MSKRSEDRARRRVIDGLRDMNNWASGRIAAGDFDFDNVVYRTRDASAVLLEIWGDE